MKTKFYLFLAFLGIVSQTAIAQITQSVPVRSASKLVASFLIKERNYDVIRKVITPDEFIPSVMKRFKLENFTLRDMGKTSLSANKTFLYSFRMKDGLKHNGNENDYYMNVNYVSECADKAESCLLPFSFVMDKAFSDSEVSDLFEVGIDKKNGKYAGAKSTQLLNTLKLNIDGKFNPADKTSLVTLTLEVDLNKYKELVCDIQNRSNVTDTEVLAVVDEVYNSFFKYLTSKI